MSEILPEMLVAVGKSAAEAFESLGETSAGFYEKTAATEQGALDRFAAAEQENASLLTAVRAHPAPAAGQPPRPRLRTASLQRKYVDENRPVHSLLGSRPGVTYLRDEAQRAQRLITVQNGKLYDADGLPFDTTRSSTVYNEGRAIWVMDPDGNLYASTEQKVYVFQHSSFLAGGDVAGAGEMVVTDGELRLISDQSGHYHPSASLTLQVIEHLRNQGVDMADVEVEWRSAEESRVSPVRPGG